MLGHAVLLSLMTNLLIHALLQGKPSAIIQPITLPPYLEAPEQPKQAVRSIGSHGTLGMY